MQVQEDIESKNHFRYRPGVKADWTGSESSHCRCASKDGTGTQYPKSWPQQYEAADGQGSRREYH